MEAMPGYAGTILQVDLAARTTAALATARYASAIGGRGLATRLYGDFGPAGAGGATSEAPLIVAAGPLAGFTGLAGSRWVVCGRSPIVTPAVFCYSNLGGSFGAHLKFAGCDALAITGIADAPVVLVVRDGRCTFHAAAHLWGRGAAHTRRLLKEAYGSGARVLAVGPAGENGAVMATVLADEDACGAGGLGAAMGAKRLKAVVVAGDRKPSAADPAALSETRRFLRRIKRKSPGKLLPAPEGLTARRQICFGCIAGCDRSEHRTAGGRRGKYMCASGPLYEPFVRRYRGRLGRVPFEATRLCDDHGLDIGVLQTIMEWLDRCHRAGVLTETQSGLPLSRIGSLEFIKTLVTAIARREGLGDLLARGPQAAADALGADCADLLGDSVALDGTFVYMCPRLYLAHALIFALEPRQPIALCQDFGGSVLRWLGVRNPPIDSAGVRFLARRFWGGEAAADFTTPDGKALAVKRVQARTLVKESAGLCHFSWHVSAVEMFRPSIVAEVLRAVTGQAWDETELESAGDRLVTLQRAVILRDRGCGREADRLPEWCFTTPLTGTFDNPQFLVPGPGGDAVSRGGAVLDRRVFEAMKDEYYALQNWDVGTGRPTPEQLHDLGL